jgi:tetratricopeptide (TPR) repeat protein
MPRLRPVAALLVCFLAAGARANANAAGDKREVDARADFAAGRYQEAIELFAQLYGETTDPVYLRNIGRCHQQLRQPQQAIDAFRTYLARAKKKISPEERAEIDGYIAEMERLQGAESAPGAAPAAAAAPAPVPAAPAPAAPTAAAPTAAPAAVPPPGDGGPPGASLAVSSSTTGPEASAHGHLRRTAGLVTAIAGLALVGVGVGYGLAARSAASDVSARYDPGRADSGRTDEKIGIAADIVGVAAILGGTALLLGSSF